MSQLFADCLNEIFEYLEKDKVSLYSCLLVNRLWCEVSVRILWKSNFNDNYRAYNTLISCLPEESKEILSKNGIIISTQTLKPPMFNYAAFGKILSINQVYNQVDRYLSQNLNIFNIIIVTQELLKLFVKQMPSLKKLSYDWYIPNLIFTSYPEAKFCLKNLSELECSSDINSRFFYHLSQICHNIQSFDIKCRKVISNGLTDLISVQQNLKSLKILQGCENLIDILIPSLTTKLSNTITILKLNCTENTLLSFINNFTNLQELELTFYFNYYIEGFEKLQYTIFPQLQILKIRHSFPRYEFLITFLEINGRNLTELYLGEWNGYSDDLLNLAIAKFCTNIRKLSTGFENNESETFKMVFNACQYLESIKIWCCREFLSEKEALEAFAKYSHKNVSELILYYKSN